MAELVKCSSDFCDLPARTVRIACEGGDHDCSDACQTAQRPSLRINRSPVTVAEYRSYLRERSFRLGAILRGCGSRKDWLRQLQSSGVPQQCAGWGYELLANPGETAELLLKRAKNWIDNSNYCGVKLRPIANKEKQTPAPAFANSHLPESHPVIGLTLPEAEAYCGFYGRQLIDYADWSFIMASPPKTLDLMTDGKAEWMRGGQLLMSMGGVDTWWGRIRDWLGRFPSPERTPVGFRCGWSTSQDSMTATVL